jgi:hypothetical protein
MKVIIGALAVFGVAVAGIVLSSGSQVARAETVTFSVQASGANEVPAVSSGGAASAEFTFDDETNELTYVVAVRGVPQDQVTAAHIHRGAAAEAGPVAYTLAEEGFIQIAGSVMLSDEDADLLRAGGLYLNVHSVDHPDGFARGQLIPPEAATSEGGDEADATPSANPTEQVAGTGDIAPPNTGDGGLAAGAGVNLMQVIILAAMLGLGSSALLVRKRV